MFKELKSLQAIQVENAGYLVKPYVSGNGSSLRIEFPDGTFSEFLAQYNKEYFIETGCKLSQAVSEAAKVVAVRLKDGTELSVAEHNRMCDAITEDLEQDEYGNYIYQSLEEEFSIRKRLLELEPIDRIYSTPSVTWEPIEFKVVGHAFNTGSPFIESCIFAGRLPASNVGMFEVKTSKIAMDEAKKIVDDNNLSLENRDHPSMLRFAKLSDDYIFSGYEKLGYIQEANAVRYSTTIDDARIIEREVRDKIREIFARAISRINRTHISYAYSSTGSIVDALDRTLSNLTTVSATSRVGREALDRAQSELRKIIKFLNTELIKQLK